MQRIEAARRQVQADIHFAMVGAPRARPTKRKRLGGWIALALIAGLVGVGATYSNQIITQYQRWTTPPPPPAPPPFVGIRSKTAQLWPGALQVWLVTLPELETIDPADPQAGRVGTKLTLDERTLLEGALAHVEDVPENETAPLPPPRTINECFSARHFFRYYDIAGALVGEIALSKSCNEVRLYPPLPFEGRAREWLQIDTPIVLAVAEEVEARAQRERLLELSVQPRNADGSPTVLSPEQTLPSPELEAKALQVSASSAAPPTGVQAAKPKAVAPQAPAAKPPASTQPANTSAKVAAPATSPAQAAAEPPTKAATKPSLEAMMGAGKADQ